MLDTKVVSELRKASAGHPRVKAWEVAMPVSLQYISANMVLEIERGGQRLPLLVPLPSAFQEMSIQM